jgi:DNA-binding CsgD family transcriptional regulator
MESIHGPGKKLPEMVSRREYQVAELIAWGASDKEIAQELEISPETAKTHRKNILHKIDGHNAADITRWFFQKKCRISFGLNPRQIMHLAVFLLGLVIFDEFVDNSEMLRARRIRMKAAKTARYVRSRVKTGRKYEFQPLVA